MKTVTIKMIINKKTDSFGTKTVIFLAKEGGVYISSRDEGSHADLSLGNIILDGEKIEDGNCTL